MSGLLFLILIVIALVAGLVARQRVRRSLRDRSRIVGDDLLRSILERGEVDTADDDEPLDEEAIREAEDAFWEEDEWIDADNWQD